MLKVRANVSHRVATMWGFKFDGRREAHAQESHAQESRAEQNGPGRPVRP
jgi:hypothetical protein